MAEHELLVVVTTPEGKVYNHRSYSVSADAVDGGITILPVSYTHLDVYKRQLLSLYSLNNSKNGIIVVKEG